MVVAVAAGVVFLLTRHADAGPDPYAGTYPLLTPVPSPTGSPPPTWRPTGRPAGPLPVFHGTASRVSGRVTDRTAGVSYARFAAPFHRPKSLGVDTTGGELMDGGRTGGFGHYWYVAVYSGLLPAKFRPAATGPNALRAGAELYGQDWADELYDDSDKRTELAGQAMMIGGHHAWLSVFRMTHADGLKRVDPSQTEAVVTIDTGRTAPAVVSVTVPSNKNALLPDINTVVRSLRVVR